ncbi:hypothetical protein V1507DRAFT_447133 [Lipomyces tetrasporus]
MEGLLNFWRCLPAEVADLRGDRYACEKTEEVTDSCLLFFSSLYRNLVGFSLLGWWGFLVLLLRFFILFVLLDLFVLVICLFGLFISIFSLSLLAIGCGCLLLFLLLFLITTLFFFFFFLLLLYLFFSFFLVFRGTRISIFVLFFLFFLIRRESLKLLLRITTSSRHSDQ